MEENVKWVTLKDGRRVPIKIKSTSDYMNFLIRSNQSLKVDDKSKEQTPKERIVDIVNNGQVVDFSMGPTMTICSVYKDGDYKPRISDVDAPMFEFEDVIIPKLNDEFVVVDEGVTKLPRSSRFKKYGYEPVETIKQTEYDFKNGVYTTQEYDSDYGDKWILMRKIQKAEKPLTRKDLMASELYKGADGYWNIDLKDGYTSEAGWNYIWEKSKRQALIQLDSLVRAENRFREIEKKKNKEE